MFKIFCKVISGVYSINVKTIIFNFKYLPFNHAIHLPIKVSKNVYLKKVQGKINIEGNVRYGMIEIGFGNVGIFDKNVSRSIWEVSGNVVFKGTAKIGHGSKISVSKLGKLIIGDNFRISAESSIVCWKEIVFGNNCLISWDNLIMDTDLHSITDSLGNLLNAPKKIYIGNNVWIGCRCLILKGTQIPDDSIIAANSVLNKILIGQNKIFGGSPITTLRDNVYWNDLNPTA